MTMTLQELCQFCRALVISFHFILFHFISFCCNLQVGQRLYSWGEVVRANHVALRGTWWMRRRPRYNKTNNGLYDSSIDSCINI